MKIGSLFTGYGGLDKAAIAVAGGDLEWVTDNDPGAARIAAHRFPDAPNLGDVTTIDWSTVPKVDILTGGYPCQPFSNGGNRKGLTDERHLWPYVREAIRHLRPRVTFLENVSGHRSMGFDRVLGDLAEDGLHARWISVRASDVGAPHQRERLFAAVADPDDVRPFVVQEQPRGITESGRGAVADPDEQGLQGRESTWGRFMSTWRVAQLSAAVHRWERLTRPAPDALVLAPRGGLRVNARFSEWMMGLPDGWVTDVPGLSYAAQMKALGNGVVPQQAALAITELGRRW